MAEGSGEQRERRLRRARRSRGEEGAAAVEFALVVVPLLVILVGIMSYGYMLSFRQAISQAAAEGARAAAVTPEGTAPEVREQRALEAVDAALGSYGVSCGSAATVCTIVIDASCGVVGCARVEVDYDYELEPLTPVFPGLGIVMPEHLVYEAVAEVS